MSEEIPIADFELVIPECLEPGMMINRSFGSDSRNFLVTRIVNKPNGDILVHVLRDDGHKDSIAYSLMQRCMSGEMVRVISRTTFKAEITD